MRLEAITLAAALTIATLAKGEDLTFQAALARARASSPVVRSADTDVAAAESDVAAASRSMFENPTLEAIAGPRKSDTGETMASYTITLDQPLDIGGRRSARIEAARAALDLANARRDLAIRDAVAGVAVAYVQAAAATERVSVTRRDEALARDIERIAERRFELGDVAVIDVNATKADVAQAHAETLVAEGERDGALARLRSLLGYAPDAPITVTTDLASIAGQTAAPLSSETPEVLQARAQLRAANAEIAVARAQARPDFGLAAEQAREEGSRVLMAGGHITLPVFHRGRAEIRAAQERAHGAEAQLEAAQRQADGNRRAAIVEFDRRSAAAKVLQDTALPLLVDNERLIARSYEVGEIDLAELLTLRRQTNIIRLSAIGRRADAAQAWIDFVRATGAPFVPAGER